MDGWSKAKSVLFWEWHSRNTDELVDVDVDISHHRYSMRQNTIQIPGRSIPESTHAFLG